jgi:hypothetical protein
LVDQLHQATLRLNAALICERVLEERDGTLSIIRIAERLAVDVTRLPSEGNEPFVHVPGVLVLVFKRDSEAATEHRIHVRGTDPSGREILNVAAPLRIAAGAGRGADLIIRLSFPVSSEGLHWVDVAADEHLLTRVPIEVVIRARADEARGAVAERRV